MKNLGKSQQAMKSGHFGNVRTKYEALERIIAEFNLKLKELQAPVEQALADLNTAVRAADCWREEINQIQIAFYDARSKRWQESEKGQNYCDWKDDWGREFQHIYADFPPEMEAPECLVITDLENFRDEHD